MSGSLLTTPSTPPEAGQGPFGVKRDRVTGKGGGGADSES